MIPFDDEVVRSITGYMNENQPDINLLIVQTHGHAPAATSAELTDVGGSAATFLAQVDGSAETIIVPWRGPITRREHIRRELMELYESAAEL
jgi:hypothetical protein